jgi:hypothetical protein
MRRCELGAVIFVIKLHMIYRASPSWRGLRTCSWLCLSTRTHKRGVPKKTLYGSYYEKQVPIGCCVMRRMYDVSVVGMPIVTLFLVCSHLLRQMDGYSTALSVACPAVDVWQSWARSMAPLEFHFIVATSIRCVGSCGEKKKRLVHVSFGLMLHILSI